MIKIDKHIEIVRSSTKDLSSMSQESCDAIQAVLTKYYTSVRVSNVNNLPDLEAIVSRDPDLVFLGMKFIPVNSNLGWQDPDKIWLTTYFDNRNIAYTGSSQIAHGLERNKPAAKQRVLDVGLRTATFCVIKQNQSLVSSDIPLSFPLFIKPANRGGGLGVNSDSLAYNFEQLFSKVHSIADLQSDSLIEEYLPGREFSVAILKDEYSAEFSVMPIELIAPLDKNGVRILSGEIKSSNTEQAIEITDKVTKSKVTSLALNVFHALGARDYGRIDIRLDKQGIPHFLEANLIPSLISGYGSFPKACMLNIGLGYESMIIRIAKLGLARNINNIEGALELNMAMDDSFPYFGTALKTI
jgi:D-alanine-D-alanine ligase